MAGQECMSGENYSCTKQGVFYRELIAAIKKSHISKQKLNAAKMQLCRKHGITAMPTDIDILMHASLADVKAILPYLQTKPVRTGSGVAVIAIMTRPARCPHGKCTMCPGGLKSHFGDVPQSYTGHEPATLRGMRNNYDAYLQVMNRLEQYVVLGQLPSKADVIIMGGTFPAQPLEYQEEFVTDLFRALNDFSGLFFKKGAFDWSKFKEFFSMPGEVGSKERTEEIHAALLKMKQKKTSLLREQTRNETAQVKCIGLTIETRPDWAFLRHGNEMLKLGCTRIELGVQTVYAEALKRVHRGHTLQDSIKSIQLLKDLGFKLNFHLMPGLPGISKQQDIKGLQQIFLDARFRPDMLKVYPTMVMPGTPLYLDYMRGKFKPLTTRGAAEIIVEMKKMIPEYCRIMRIQRDIPTKVTVAGVDRTNLRQEVQLLMKKKGYVCRCIRCREIRNEPLRKTALNVLEYAASNGQEFFISLESNDAIVGFCRLRFPSQYLRPEITKKSALIRELHVYSSQLAVGKKPGKTRHQHKGFGRQLMHKAEEIAKAHGKTKMVVISGIGAREYYKKLGYRSEGVYMVKQL
ncbi:MAG: tRNA uridine(34) 5-carboxymethylaminomethyl modification radical SAM/GNAT enzyme Elp3 [Nanoarchaeota archaeon]